jgi:hypothetical protein
VCEVVHTMGDYIGTSRRSDRDPQCMDPARQQFSLQDSG